MDELSWYAVRCVLRTETADNDNVYEERITLWRADGPDEAIQLAEAEAAEYADALGGAEYLRLAQSYHLPEPAGHGAEVFSLVRRSQLDPGPYLDAFFDTGEEFQQTDADEP